MIRNLVFDLGNVIVEYNPSQIVATLFKDEQERKLILQEVFLSKGWKQLDQGLITFEEHYQNVASRLPQYADEIEWLLKNWYKDPRYLPGVYSMIKTISYYDFDMYVLSNASELYYNHAQDLEIFKFFTGITISAELKLLKPQKEIYDRFCQIHQLRPEECLFIDDQLENVLGARNAGWTAHQFTGVEKLKFYLQETLQIKF